MHMPGSSQGLAEPKDHGMALEAELMSLELGSLWALGPMELGSPKILDARRCVLQRHLVTARSWPIQVKATSVNCP